MKLYCRNGVWLALFCANIILSDIVFGATLGWVVGHTIAGKHKNLELAGFQVIPYMTQTKNDNTDMGITMLKQF